MNKTLWNKVESLGGDVSAFPKWARVLKEKLPDISKVYPWISSPHGKSTVYSWISAQRGKIDYIEQLDNINERINEIKYTLDKHDVWHTPAEFVSAGSGDCEDYAISKFFLLRYLGYRDEALRLVCVRYSYTYHMILVVYLGPDIIIMDNRTDLKREDEVLNYVPIYSLNEENWWRYHSR